MKQAYLRIFAALATAALFAGLVYAVLQIANVAEPASSAVHGTTTRRFWATLAAAFGLAGAVGGCLALFRPGSRFRSTTGRLGIAASGIVASVNGGLVLSFAEGGPGSGNGVVGGAVALVLGVIAIALGCLAGVRFRCSV